MPNNRSTVTEFICWLRFVSAKPVDAIGYHQPEEALFVFSFLSYVCFLCPVPCKWKRQVRPSVLSSG